MTRKVPGIPDEYQAWLDGVEPTWALLNEAAVDALWPEPPAAGGPLRLAADLDDGEVADCAMVRNALVLLGAASEGDGLNLTARGNLTRAEVAAMRDAMEWPGCAFEEKWRAGKQLSERHVEELRLVRALLERSGNLERAGARLRLAASGRAAMAGRLARLHDTLFRTAFWRVSLDLFGDGECGAWPQQLIGVALWSLAITGDRWQDTGTLMRQAVLPNDAVSRNPDFVPLILFAMRVLRPLLWFGLVERKVEAGDTSREGGTWRKTPLFDRYLHFYPHLAGTGRPLH